MSSRIVTLPMEKDYPFSLSTEHGLPRTTVQVRKTIELHMEPRYIMREKIRLLKAMAEPRLVALLATN